MRQVMLSTSLMLASTLGCVASPTPVSNDRESYDHVRSALAHTNWITVRYFDPSRERRTISSIGSIADEYHVESKVQCSGQSCLGSMRELDRVLLSAQPLAARCRFPYYGRIALQSPQSTIFLYIDFSGTCIELNGRRYRVDRDILRLISERPPSAW